VPWTFAHPALILPLKKVFPKQLYFLGLVVGSIVPDLGYYMGLWSLSSFAHTLKGVVCVCLPFGLFMVYVLYLAGPYIAILLPDPHRTAFLGFVKIEDRLEVKSACFLLIAIILGSLSHLLWDSFTHASGAIVKSSELLQAEIIKVGTLHIYGYTLMQHLSSFVGVAILFWVYYSWLKKNNLKLFFYNSEEAWRYKLIVCQAFVAALIASPISYFNVQHFMGAKAASAFIVDFAFVFTPIYFILLLVTVLCMAAKKNIFTKAL
jgi:hypothetical protein